jgi:hypothetical protein
LTKEKGDCGEDRGCGCMQTTSKMQFVDNQGTLWKSDCVQELFDWEIEAMGIHPTDLEV